MRAFAIEEFGAPGAVRDLPVPEPGPGEVRIRVAAAGMNPVDSAVVQGYLKDIVEHRLPLVPGIDASGTIDAMAEDVQGWNVGEEVFAASGKPYFGGGTYAEQATVSASSMAHKPSSVTHEQAAAIPTAGVTALMLADALELKEGKVILAIGAVGGVGSYFVQLAAERGARVIAVCRSVNADYVRSLGAEDVIDYTAEDVGDAIAVRYNQGVDGIADMVGDKEELDSAVARVKTRGRVASCVRSADEAELAQRGLTGRNVNGAATTERLDLLASARTDGRLRDPAIETLPLDGASEALARLAEKHVRGKLVLQVGA
jgi:NADPH:quinone reductase